MKSIHLSLLAATAVMVAGCQTAQQAADRQKVTRHEPKLVQKADGLFYVAGQDKPHTGKHTAWYSNGEMAWQGHIKEGKRHGEYSQWHAVKDLLHVKGQYKDGKRDGDWGQWYFNGQQEMTSTYSNGQVSNTVYYSEKGEVVPQNVYMAALYRKVQKQGRQNDWLRTGGDAYVGPSHSGGMGGFGGSGSGFTGGGSASDYHNSTIGK